MDSVINKIQAAVQNIIWNNSPFYGCLLQEINFRITKDIPTAALHYDKKTERFSILINDEYFGSHEKEQREAIMLHEILHFTHTHIQRFAQLGITEDTQLSMMVAADLAINQLIKDLPKEAVSLDAINKEFNLNLPKLRSMEEYYESLKNLQQQQKKGKSGKTLEQFVSHDEHPWDGSMSPDEMQGMLKEMKSVIKRTVEKTELYGPSTVPDSVKTLLEDLEVQIQKLDYKRILRSVIKRTLTVSDREHTWYRPNKRYGMFTKGTQEAKAPEVYFFNDSSGSISVREQNEYLKIMEGFLKAGSKKCSLGFWHTALYYLKPYRFGREINSNDIESGGTDVGPVLEYIKKNKPALSIILTDGCFVDPGIENVGAEVLWIISENGNEDHPVKYLGKTIALKHLK